jgi:hypothetical protein
VSYIHVRIIGAGDPPARFPFRGVVLEVGLLTNDVAPSRVDEQIWQDDCVEVLTPGDHVEQGSVGLRKVRP